MTGTLTYSSDAKARVQQRGQRELRRFFDEVSVRLLLPYLPPVDGFRPGSAAGAVKQKETLARRLTRPTAHEKDFNALFMIWRAWIHETQSNSSLIQTLIDELEEAAANADGPEAKRLVIEQHTDSLLQKLREESNENRSTREGIERLYTFSPLPETEAARGIISAAKLAADVERDATYRNLPTRLQNDEREIQAIRSDIKSLTSRVTAIGDECAKIIRELPGVRDSIRQTQKVAESARAAAEKANKLSRDSNESGPITLVVRIKSLSEDIDALRASVGALTASLGPLKELPAATKTLADAQRKIVEEQKQYAERVDQISAMLGEVRRNVDVLFEARMQPDRIAPLTEQIVDLVRRVDSLSVAAQSSHEPEHVPARPANKSGALHWESLPTTGNPAQISTCAGLAIAFADALMFLGVRKSHAQLLAEECTAAIAARQAVFLQGAFASRVAQALAVAIGGAGSARLAMPVGVMDGGELRLGIEEAFASLRDSVGGLAIEGINHVPFDLIREIIADCIAPTASPNASHRRIAVFATLSRGVASISVEPEVLELGPIFDLDFLDWRTNASPVPPPQATVLSTQTDQAIFAQLARVNVNLEESVRLVQALARKRNPAVERIVVRAYQALHLTRSEPQTVTQLHSLLFGWLLPYWRALDLSRAQIGSEFDGSNVNGVPTDGRLAAMFAAEFANGEKGHP